MVSFVIRGFPWARWLFGAGALATVALLAAEATGRPMPWWAVVSAALLVLTALGGGIFVMGAGLFARPVLAVDEVRAQGRLALTFDDGPNAEVTRKIAELLESRGHRGTFFPIGRRAGEYLAMLGELVRRGHGLGNHSFSHAHTLPFFGVERLTADLEQAQAVFDKAAGVRPRWFRPPVGILSPRVVAAAKRARLELVGWSGTARDGIDTPVDAAAMRLLRRLKPGAILVLHDGAEQAGRTPIALAVLERVLDEMARRGLRSVTLDELLEER
jgi:peptidoglycan/xylan/chitin deacetylase (PgdA/CDA1 family)